MEMFVEERDHPRRRCLYPGVLSLAHNYRGDHAAADRGKRGQKSFRERSLAIIDVRFQNRIVGKLRKIVRRLRMANEKFVIRSNQQNRERRFAPSRPYVITYLVGQPERLG